VYQLPLRTLTEQIAVECRAVMGRLGLEVPVHPRTLGRAKTGE